MKTLENIVSLCKRKGFIYQSSSIYGGLSSAWDYGPLGTLLKRNLQNTWFDTMLKNINVDIMPFDSSILMHKDIWKTSGHVDNFSDPLVDCKVCKARFRADMIDIDSPCKNCGSKNSFTEPRNFNLMFSTKIGSVEDDSSTIYLRPETAQGIYVNFKNIIDSFSPKLPFGLAQVGKAFRNEIITKNFIFRTCEFEQMEMQFFVHPEDEKKWYDYWIEKRMEYYVEKIGINPEDLRLKEHEKLAHYAKSACDIEYNFPFGFQELEGIHNRGDFDLNSHSKATKKELSYFDSTLKQKFIPSIIECSSGLNRLLLAVLSQAYREDEVNGQSRAYLSFHPNLVPYQVAVLPLVKKDGLPEIAKEVLKDLNQDYMCQYEESNSIGKRYRKQDEIGTLFCVTIDYDTIKDNRLTVRNRDSMKQDTVFIKDLKKYLKDKIENWRL